MTQSPDVPQGTELLHALQRVQGGHIVVRAADEFADGDQPLPRTLVRHMRELFANGQVRLEEQPGIGPPLVLMTTAGEELLAELEDDPGPST